MECGDYIKNKHSGLKQNNVPLGGRASAQKPAVMLAFFLGLLLCEFWSHSVLGLPIFFYESKFFAGDANNRIVFGATRGELSADTQLFHNIAKAVY